MTRMADVCHMEVCRMELVPHWNLESIYPGISSAEFEADLAALKKIEQDLKALVSTPGPVGEFKAWFTAVLDLVQQGWDTAETLGSFANAMLTVNTSDEKAMRGLNRVEEASLGIRAANVKVLNALAAHQDDVRQLLHHDNDFYRYLS